MKSGALSYSLNILYVNSLLRDKKFWPIFSGPSAFKKGIWEIKNITSFPVIKI